MSQESSASADRAPQDTPSRPGLALATFGEGCFWCAEAVFSEMEGVVSVTSGYAGGHVPHPTYDQVCTGTTGHAEVAQIEYDPKRVSFRDLLEVFFKTHDPTTRDRQGHDVGTQYRSVIFWHDQAQRRVAEETKAALDASGAFDAPIVTEIVPFEHFWPAEAHHQDFFAKHPEQAYCRAVIAPKVEKFRKVFGSKLRH
jgi:peptide-methionine (S)-S-oxide reductase